MKKFLLLILFLSLISFNVSACGDPDYPIISEPEDIANFLSKNLVNESKNYSAYLFSDKINPIFFYLIFNYSEENEINTKNIELIKDIIKNPNYNQALDSFKNWLKTKSDVTGKEFKYDYWYRVSLNSCTFGTFDNAVKTLNSKKETYSDVEMNKLIENYDIVFNNCFSKENTINLEGNNCPSEKIFEDLEVITSSEQKLNFFEKIFQSIVSLFNKLFGISREKEISYISLNEDQDYQNALYYFYRANYSNICDYQTAQTFFKKIMDNPNHSWYVDAHLGYAKALVRENLTLASNNVYNKEKIRNTINILNTLIERNDVSLYKDAFKAQKEKLLFYVFDEESLIKAGKNLVNNDDIRHDLIIIKEQMDLVDKNNISLSYEFEENEEFLQFIYYWNSDLHDKNKNNSIKVLYNNSNNKGLWLTLLLKELSFTKDKEESIFIKKATKIDESNLFYYPVNYYLNKIILKTDKGKAKNNILSLAENAPEIAYNYFYDLASESIENIDDLINFSTRRSIAENYGIRYYELPEKTLLMSEKYTSFISNNIPLEVLYNNEIIMKFDFNKIFVRSFILGYENIFSKMLEDLAETDDNFKNALDSKDKTERDFLITYAILHSKNFKIALYNSYENNFCKYLQKNIEENEYDKLLTSVEREKNKIENNKLNKTPLALFFQKTVDYAGIYPNDEKIPETLHYLIFFDRYNSCGGFEDYPSIIFNYLHRNYPNSTWADKTPYYY